MGSCSLQDDGDYNYISGVHYFTSDVEYDVSGDSKKMLLDENNKLQTRLNSYEDRLHDKDLEIANLTKQMTAQNEMNESRLKIYERLEDNIEDLERENQKLMRRYKSDKTAMEMLMNNIEQLESSCTLYKAKIEDLTMEMKNMKMEMKKMEKLQEATPPTTGRNSPAVDKSLEINCTKILTELSQCQDELTESEQRTKHLEKHVQELGQKIKDFEDQMCYVNNVNRAENDSNSSTTACTCKKDLPSVYEEVEEDDSFLVNINKESQILFNEFNFTSDPPKPGVNMYKDLVEKYQKLLDLHRVKIEDNKCISNDSGFSTLETTELKNTDASVQTESLCTEFKHELGSICVFGDINEQLLATLETTLQTYNYRRDGTTTQQYEEASNTPNQSSGISDEPANITFVTSTPEANKLKSKWSQGSSLFKEMMKENFRNDITPIKSYSDSRLIPQPKLIPLVRKPIEEMVLVPASKKSHKKKNNKQPLKPQLVGDATWKVAPATKKSKAKTLNAFRTPDSNFNNLSKSLE